jgi:type IV secretion system protein VirD4
MVLGFAIPFFGHDYWAPLSDPFLRVGFFVLGVTISFLMIRPAFDQSWSATLLRVVIPLGFFAAAGIMFWAILRFVPSAWDSTPYGDSSTLLFAEIGRLNNFTAAYEAFLVKYLGWTLTLALPAASSLLAGMFTAKLFIVKPLAASLAGNRDAAGGPWDGAWMAPERVRELARNQSGLPLGLKGRAIARYEPNAAHKWPPGHHMVVAGTRAGKGVACIIPAIIDHDGPVVAIDIKGENFAICRRYRQSLGRRQIVLNPFHVIEDRTSHYDPLTYLRPDHLQRDIATLCDGLIKPESSSDSSWISNAARNIFEAAVELVMTTADETERTLLTVTSLVLAPNRLETFAAWTEAGTLCNGRIAQAGAKITQMGDRQQGAVLDCLSENLEWLKYDQVRAMLGKSDFRLDELLDDKIDLYLVVPQDMTEELSNFMRMMMTLAMGTITRQDGRRQAKAKILAVLDEFTRLGRMEKVMEIATIAAGGGIEAIFVVQDRGTLDNIYTPNGATTLLGSCATTRIFDLGRTDDKTANWAENQMRHKTIIRESQNHRNAKKEISHNEGKERLLDSTSIQEMPANQMLCFIRNNQAILLARISH